ncbi:dnaJ homolog subfamily C member 24 isoform X3 [Stigmatopora nigra]
MSLKKDLYAILGASPSDSVQELRHKYQKLVLQYHPDRLGDVCDFEAETSMKMFLEIDAAWKILCEVESRKIYDQQTRDREFKQDWPVDSVVSLKDMTWDQGKFNIDRTANFSRYSGGDKKCKLRYS